MMVEMLLESSQDFGMSNGVLPQWKRELLQRRAARPRVPLAAPPSPPPPPCPPPPPPAPDDDEELRYGPGIVKRLKSRYLSLALRDAPRRRPSVLRRAASLEHLLDEPAPAPPPPPPRPASLSAVPPRAAAPAPQPLTRRDYVKRARSVDALSRLESREEVPPPVPSARAPGPPRSARPPRRPQPLLRDTERPPCDVVRAALRKFEPTVGKRAAPAARVAAVLRGLEQRGGTPESTAAPEETAAAPAATRPVSRAALDGIARAGHSVRYSFPAPRAAPHLPPLAAANPVLLARSRLDPQQPPRRVGVIRPLPPAEPATPPAPSSPHEEPRKPDPAPEPVLDKPILAEKTPPPSALVEPVPRSPREDTPPIIKFWERRIDRLTPDLEEPITNGFDQPKIEIEKTSPLVEKKTSPWIDKKTSTLTEKKTSPLIEKKIIPFIEKKASPLTNGHKEASPERNGDVVDRSPRDEEKLLNGVAGKPSRISGAKIEQQRSWSHNVPAQAGLAGGWSPTAARKPRPPPPAATSVVFNFSDRKEVPDYIENDGVIRRTNKRDKYKAGDPGVVVLHPEALAASDSDSEGEGAGIGEGRPPTPCEVRFINDNVLINGKSSLTARPDKDRIAKLKLQFDDSLTRTFEYPSETSLCEEESPRPAPAPASPAAPAAPAAPASPHTPPSATGHGVFSPLATNTLIASTPLCRYTPAQTRGETFELGVTRLLHDAADAHHLAQNGDLSVELEVSVEAVETEALVLEEVESAWSAARAANTDLLF